MTSAEDDDFNVLVADLIEQHGGKDALSKTHVAVIRRIATLLASDAEFSAGTLTNLMELLPKGHAAIGDNSALVYVEPDVMTNDQVQSLAATLRVFNPSAEALCQLADENAALKSRLERAATAFAWQNLGLLRAELYGEDAPQQPPAPETAPAASPARPAAIPVDPPHKAIPPPCEARRELTDHDKAMARLRAEFEVEDREHARQSALSPLASGPPAHSRFDYGARGE